MQYATREVCELPRRQSLVKKRFHRVLEAAELPRIRLYDLRHTAAMLAVAAGVSVKAISEQLGHASTHPRLEDLDECPEAKELIFFSEFGRPVNLNSLVYKHFKPILTRARLPMSNRPAFQLPTSRAPMRAPSSMSVSRVIPCQMTLLPGGGS